METDSESEEVPPAPENSTLVLPEQSPAPVFSPGPENLIPPMPHTPTPEPQSSTPVPPPPKKYKFGPKSINGARTF